MRSSLALWRDRRGRVSALRIATLALLVTPIGLAIAAAFTEDGFGARPINDLIHRAGYWTLMFLLLALAVTPLARIARFGQLMDVRRMIGVGAFCYAAAHILLFVADKMYDLATVGLEIALRLYLTIGFIALVGLGALAFTSTDAMVRKLGPARWQRLHQLIYVIVLLALLHFFQQTKADVWVPTFFAGVICWLLGYRLMVRYWRPKGDLTPWHLLALAVIVAGITFAGEAIGIGIAYSVSPLLVLQMAVDFDLETIPPGWLVFGAGLCVVALDVARAWWRRPKGRRGAPVPAQAPASVSAKSVQEVA